MAALSSDTIFMLFYCDDVSIHMARYEPHTLVAIHLDDMYFFSMNIL